MSSGSYSQQGPLDAENDVNALVFAFNQMLNKLAGPTLVKVIKCTNTGGVAAQGTVDVQPLVNQMTGNRQPIKHGIVKGLPYMRIMGSTNAVIMDPQPGDIGLACFASRDISAVKASKAQANPGSFRTWDWADGLYLYSFLGGVPSQYFQFDASGITCVSPTKITMRAPTVEIDASSGVTVTTPLVSMSDSLDVATEATIGGIAFTPHTHGGVQTGSGDTGAPV